MSPFFEVEYYFGAYDIKSSQDWKKDLFTWILLKQKQLDLKYQLSKNLHTINPFNFLYHEIKSESL